MKPIEIPVLTTTQLFELLAAQPDSPAQKIERPSATADEDWPFLPSYPSLGLVKRVWQDLDLPPPPKDWKNSHDVDGYAAKLRGLNFTKINPSIEGLFFDITQKRIIAEKFYETLHAHNPDFYLPENEKVLFVKINKKLLTPRSDARVNFAANLRAYRLHFTYIGDYLDRVETRIDHRWARELYPEFVRQTPQIQRTHLAYCQE